jgi:hypothetical protein
MIRPLTCVTILLACGSGLYLYQTKHQAQVLDKQIEHAVKLAASTRMQTRELTAAWTLLGSPDRLQQLSDQYLDIRAVLPSQFVAMSDLDSKLPVPRAVEAPSSSAPDNTGTGTFPLATAEPPPASTAPAQTTVASIATPVPPAVTAIAPPSPAPPTIADPLKTAVVVSRPTDRKPIDISRPPRDAAQRDVTTRDVTTRDTGPSRDQTAPRDVALARPAPPRPISPPMVAELERQARPSPPRLAPMQVSGSLLGMARTSVPAPVPISTLGN